VLSRRNLFYPSRRSSPNPRRLILLQTLLHSQKSQLLCNEANPNSFGEIPGVGVSPNSVPPCLCGNPDLSPLAKGFKSTKTATLTTFRINTCKSVSKQRTLTPFRINTYKKGGRGYPGTAGLHMRRVATLFPRRCHRSGLRHTHRVGQRFRRSPGPSNQRSLRRSCALSRSRLSVLREIECEAIPTQVFT
jgi:hypothetical protein